MSGAATALGTNVATVSRRIDRINAELGLPTLIKRSDGWEINPRLAGIVAVIEEFDAALDRELNALRVNGSETRSVLSIGCPPTVSGRVLFPGLSPDRSPPGNVNLHFSPRIFEDGLGDFDIVLRVGRPETGRVLSRLAGTLPMRLYRHRDVPLRDDHDWVGLNEKFDRLDIMRFAQATFGKPPTIRVANFEQLIEVFHAVRMPTPLPDVIARGDQELVPYPDTPVAHTEYWLMYHQTRRNDPVIRATVEWIIECFRHAQSGPNDETVS